MNTTTEPYLAQEDALTNQGHQIFILISIVVCILTSIIGIAGNGLVIYFAIQKTLDRKFRYLNKVVKQLAVADFLYSILAAPLQMVYWAEGRI